MRAGAWRLAAGTCRRADQVEPAGRLPGRQSTTPRTSSQFAKDVEAATGGKLQITVHAGASLFKAPEIKRAVATGQAQIGEVLISIHENEDPVFGIDVVPFLATSFADAKKLWRGVAAGRSRRSSPARACMVLFAVPWGPQGIYAKKDLNTVDDMKGLKWRAYNVGTRASPSWSARRRSPSRRPSCRRRSRPAWSIRSCRRARPATTARSGRR